MQVTMIVHLLLPIFEKPAAIETPYWVPCLVEFVCVLIFFARWLHLRHIENVDTFYKHKKNWVLFWTFIVNESNFYFSRSSFEICVSLPMV